MMELSYDCKRSADDVYTATPSVSFSETWRDNTNKLICGDNLSVMKSMMNYGMEGKIDLVYIDPPYGTNSVFTVADGRANSISRTGKSVAYSDTLMGEEFLEFIRERLLMLKPLLSKKWSVYLHIDYKIGHYVKILMDEVLGAMNFRNDLSRIKCNPKNFGRKAYGNIKDLILFYSSPQAVWNDPRVQYSEEDIAKLYNKTDQEGRPYTTIPLHAPGETKNGPTSKPFKGLLPPQGRHWRSAPEELERLDAEGLIEWSPNGVPRKKIYADTQEGKKMQDIWEFKDPQYPVYPTEKNYELLQSIVLASSDEKDTVMDFFCGSGTTIVAAEALGRQWIGIDQSSIAIDVARKRIQEMRGMFSTEAQYMEAIVD